MGDQVSELFIDGVGKVRFSGGIVRIDLVTASRALDTDNAGAEVEFIQRLILSPRGFARSVGSLNNLVQELVKAGVLQQGQDADG